MPSYLDDGTLVPSLAGLLDGSEAIEPSGSSTLDGSEFGPTFLEMIRHGQAYRMRPLEGDALTLVEESYESRVALLSSSTGQSISLPEATGSGGVYDVMVETLLASGSYVVNAHAGDVIAGMVRIAVDNSTTKGFSATVAGALNKITLNGTTTGGAAVGDWLRFWDVKDGVWFVQGFLTGSGSIATAFGQQV